MMMMMMMMTTMMMMLKFKELYFPLAQWRFTRNLLTQITYHRKFRKCQRQIKMKKHSLIINEKERRRNKKRLAIDFKRIFI